MISEFTFFTLLTFFALSSNGSELEQRKDVCGRGLLALSAATAVTTAHAQPKVEMGSKPEEGVSPELQHLGASDIESERIAEVRLALAEFLFSKRRNIFDKKALSVWEQIVAGKIDPFKSEEAKPYARAFADLVNQSLSGDGVLLRIMTTKAAGQIPGVHLGIEEFMSTPLKTRLFSRPLPIRFLNSSDFVRQIYRVHEVRRLALLKRSVKQFPAITLEEAVQIIAVLPKAQQMAGYDTLQAKIFTPLEMYPTKTLLAFFQQLDLQAAQYLVAQDKYDVTDPLLAKYKTPNKIKERLIAAKAFAQNEVRKFKKSTSRSKTMGLVAAALFWGGFVGMEQTANYLFPPHNDATTVSASYDGTNQSNNSALIEQTIRLSNYASALGKDSALVLFVKDNVATISADDLRQILDNITYGDKRYEASLKFYEVNKDKLTPRQIIDIGRMQRLDENKDSLLVDFSATQASRLTQDDFIDLASNAYYRDAKDAIVKNGVAHFSKPAPPIPSAPSTQSAPN